MGNTPVMDVSVLLSLLISSIINLLLALIYFTPDQFKNSAQAFFNHTVCVWCLYAYSLSQSTTDGRSPICCTVDGVQSSVYSLRLTYKEAYFGGLALHQSAADITLSFLTIFLILAAAQSRTCVQEGVDGEGPVGESPVGESPVGESPVGESPIEWLLMKTALALICLLCTQHAMFGLKAPFLQG